MEIPVDIAGEPIVNNEEEHWLEGMSLSARIRWYVLCMALGFFCSTMGYVALMIGVYWKYSVLNAVGSLISLGGTFVLKGPCAQLRYMFDEYRRVPSTVYVGSVFLTLFVAIYYGSFLLCVLCGIIQYMALIWYSLSFVPYGQEALASCLRHVVGFS